ncbi:prostaglandin reductase 1 [Folsomia candida]|uniref:prostaglandin reductase 1 n=1 Tax=Folsomia candida TaxID=158441 RepID=UPI000B8F795B|nr:prostaglandin reductase 1 [Folsomia candida]
MVLLPCKKYISKTSSLTKLADFEIIQEFIDDELDSGEILIRGLYLSPEPSLRGGGLEGKQLSCHGDLIPGSQVGKVIKSRHSSFPLDCLVFGHFGWRDLTKVKISEENCFHDVYKLPKYFDKIPISYALGALGGPGITAHCAVEKILEIKSGGTFVVSTATGAIGYLVLQIGKLKGCKTLVFTSTDEKVIWLKTLGAGYIFNYNKIDPNQVFQEFAPEGIDFYFDNIGGSFTYNVMKHMNLNGRIAVCDAISCYDAVTTVPFDYLQIVDKRIRLEGFSIYAYDEKTWNEAMNTMAIWVMEGKILVEERVLEGFETLGQAFIDRFEGNVVGIQVVRI